MCVAVIGPLSRATYASSPTLACGFGGEQGDGAASGYPKCTCIINGGERLREGRLQVAGARGTPCQPASQTDIALLPECEGRPLLPPHDPSKTSHTPNYDPHTHDEPQISRTASEAEPTCLRGHGLWHRPPDASCRSSGLLQVDLATQQLRAAEGAQGFGSLGRRGVLHEGKRRGSKGIEKGVTV